MTWFKTPNPKQGTTRVIPKFLLLPLTIGMETRWLVNVALHQEWREGGAADVIFAGWVNIKFAKDTL